MLFSILSWLHIGAAVAVVGGGAFGLFVLRPSLAGMEPPAIGKLMGGVAGRFRWIVWGSIAIFVVTGLWMATAYRDITTGSDLTATSYGRTLLGKSILSLLLFASALAITLPWKKLGLGQASSTPPLLPASEYCAGGHHHPAGRVHGA